ncbi:unnamed protein product [Candidula unifasciata]|uniref:G-protein coupled receptors family 1 profile domain-containing protein n=1 Tax=Candidula unifasciata TaxID=100452 RepID=A0A8S3ZFK3_9EUPU|nr:unnamed protein product [Candidula unifasciata]
MTNKQTDTLNNLTLKLCTVTPNVMLYISTGSITACLYGAYKSPDEPRANTSAHDRVYYNNNTGITLLASGSYSVGNTSLTQEADSLPPTSPTYTDLLADNISSWRSVDRIGATSATKKAAQIETSTCASENQEGMCLMNEDIFSNEFAGLYQKIYISFYIISLLAVFTLYFFIYRSVAERRAWRRKQKSWSHSPMTMTAGVTDVDDINKGEDIYTGERDNLELSPQNNSSHISPSNSKESGSGDSAETRIESGNSISTTKTNIASLPSNCSHENGISNTMLSPSAEKKTNRERRDFNFLANIRTALMLFVVTLVFIISFLPAWLMATEIISYEIIIFYTHFVYNVANPVIYAFMNQSFRKELKRVFQRGTHFFRHG